MNYQGQKKQFHGNSIPRHDKYPVEEMIQLIQQIDGLTLSELAPTLRRKTGINFNVKETPYGNMSVFIDAIPQLQILGNRVCLVDDADVPPPVRQTIQMESNQVNPEDFETLKDERVYFWMCLDYVDELMCLLCHEFVFRPVVTPCGHLYCFDCLKKRHIGLQPQDRKHTPIPCRICGWAFLFRQHETVSYYSGKSVGELWRTICKVKVMCFYGHCPWTGEFGRYLAHVSVCPVRLEDKVGVDNLPTAEPHTARDIKINDEIRRWMQTIRKEKLKLLPKAPRETTPFLEDEDDEDEWGGLPETEE